MSWNCLPFWSTWGHWRFLEGIKLLNLCSFRRSSFALSSFSFDHFIVCTSSSHGFWLLVFWYLQTFLMILLIWMCTVQNIKQIMKKKTFTSICHFPSDDSRHVYIYILYVLEPQTKWWNSSQIFIHIWDIKIFKMTPRRSTIISSMLTDNDQKRLRKKGIHYIMLNNISNIHDLRNNKTPWILSIILSVYIVFQSLWIISRYPW